MSKEILVIRKAKDVDWKRIREAASKGQFFKVVFEKRTKNGKKLKAGEVPEIRTMICRMGVKKHLAGGECAYSFEEKNLLPVWDVEKQKALMADGLSEEDAGKKSYRSIPVDSILSITLDV